jgi:hypothetical protein
MQVCLVRGVLQLQTFLIHLPSDNNLTDKGVTLTAGRLVGLANEIIPAGCRRNLALFATRAVRCEFVTGTDAFASGKPNSSAGTDNHHRIPARNGLCGYANRILTICVGRLDRLVSAKFHDLAGNNILTRCKRVRGPLGGPHKLNIIRHFGKGHALLYLSP